MNVPLTFNGLQSIAEADHDGIVGSNPTQGMDVCMRLFCVCIVLCLDKGLATS
jgi:hypothetical protein